MSSKSTPPVNLINDVSHEPSALATVKLVNNCTPGQFKQWTYFLVHGGARDFGWFPKCLVDGQYTHPPPPSRTQYATLMQEPTAPTPAQRASVDEVYKAGCQEWGGDGDTTGLKAWSVLLFYCGSFDRFSVTSM